MLWKNNYLTLKKGFVCWEKSAHGIRTIIIIWQQLPNIQRKHSACDPVSNTLLCTLLQSCILHSILKLQSLRVLHIPDKGENRNVSFFLFIYTTSEELRKFWCNNIKRLIALYSYCSKHFCAMQKNTSSNGCKLGFIRYRPVWEDMHCMLRANV